CASGPGSAGCRAGSACHQSLNGSGLLSDAPSGTCSCSASAQHGRRGDMLERQATAGSNLFGALEATQGRNRRVDHVDGVVRAQGLGQHVVDTGALEHRTHRTTGDDAGTRSGRTQQDHACGSLTPDRVRNGALDARDLEDLLLGLLDTLGDGRGNFLGLAIADAHGAIAIADHDERGEAEATATLDDFGDAVDGHDALDERVLVGRLVPAAAVAVATAATLVTALATACSAGGTASR